MRFRPCALLLTFRPSVTSSTPFIDTEEETIERLDSLRVDGESHDEVITDLINIYEAEELTQFHGGDEY
jgi:hypothetical protein